MNDRRTVHLLPLLLAVAACGAKESQGPPLPPGTHVGYYVATTGTPGGDGSTADPWDLQTALNGGSGSVQPGDTIWLRDGRYAGAFVSTLAGTSGAPIIVRQYPGERARIDGIGEANPALTIDGAYTRFWGFELYNSSNDRTSQAARPDVVYIRNGSNIKLVHLVVHDGGIAIYTEPTAVNPEIYGCLLYNGGWQTATRGSGHGIYVKTDATLRLVRDNIIFNQFGFGIHAYSDLGAGGLHNIRVIGNVSFNNGAIAAAGTNTSNANILVGGEEVVDSAQITDNMTYRNPSSPQVSVRVGYPAVADGSVLVRRNYFVGGTPIVSFETWGTATVDSNTMSGSGTTIFLTDTSLGGYAWGANEYFRDSTAVAWRWQGTTYSLANWKTQTGIGATDQATTTLPSQPQVFVRPSAYQAGRATIVVYNWPGQGSVSVNVSGILTAGDVYEVRNAQDWFASSPVLSGTYSGGSLSLPLAGIAGPSVIGGSATAPPVTGPAFNVFILSRLPS
ncbi:MAG TPA: right-handed parallel beta-helix repeat-containing protein [Gemmatimonadales bacterium]|jgi:hypothetical protein|nr:right-handed parallel beta-helix repeat-containing protein [Gemmatimonadales bacterium]